MAQSSMQIPIEEINAASHSCAEEQLSRMINPISRRRILIELKQAFQKGIKWYHSHEESITETEEQKNLRADYQLLTKCWNADVEQIKRMNQTAIQAHRLISGKWTLGADDLARLHLLLTQLTGIGGE